MSIRGLGKRFRLRTGRGSSGMAQVLSDIDLEVAPSEFISIIGASGSGKTTLLRIVAGLEHADEGGAYIGKEQIHGPGRERSMVFQSINLFPWRTVLQNVELGLQIRGSSAADCRQRALQFVDLVGLQNHAHAYPHELSGGMQQRVGIARALATDPQILLMDEPFGSLDAQTAEFLWDELLRLVQTTRKTVLFVTHHIDEAIYLSDRIIVLGGKPASIVDVIEVPFSKPRWEYDVRALPGFAALRARLRGHLFRRVSPATDTPQREAA